jgi:hypothetical protein
VCGHRSNTQHCQKKKKEKGEEEGNHLIFRKMDATREHHVKQNKADSERQILNVFSHMQNVDFKKDIKVEVGLLGKRK